MKQNFSNNIYLIQEDCTGVEMYVLKYINNGRNINLGIIGKPVIHNEYPHVFEWARDILLELKKGRVDEFEKFAALTVINELLAKEGDRAAGYVVPRDKNEQTV